MKISLLDPKNSALIFFFLSAVSCSQSTQSANRVASVSGENILTSSKWSSCVYVLGVGNDHLFEKRDVEFTTDGHLVMEPVALSMDSECKETISALDAKHKMGDRASLSGKVILGYKVGSAADANGHYDFDVLYGADGFGTNEYTKMALEADKLRIAKVCNFEDLEIGSCDTVNGRKPEDRADRLSQNQDLFVFTRR